MKVSPMAPGATPIVNPNDGLSADPGRLAKAKAIAMGEAAPVRELPHPTLDAQVERAQNSIKRLKMRTQMSSDRHIEPLLAAEQPIEAAVAPEIDKVAITEQTTVASDDTKPLSPQFAALAKQKRALQLKEQELLAKEKALSSPETMTKGLEDYRARIKANALKVLQEEGVTYDQLTEQILASGSGNEDYLALKAELKSLKEDVNKTLTDRDTQAETQVLSQIRKDVDRLIATGDDYEMIREAGYGPKVVELIHRVWKKEGEIMTEQEAAGLIETELLEESLKFARIKKVQSQLNPTPAPIVQTQQPVTQDRPNSKIMRTLTNRDGSSAISLSKRERAIAAMEGRLK